MMARTSDLPGVFVAYLDYLDERISFLEKLYRSNHREEALALCCTYVEGLGGKIFQEEKERKKRFVRAVLEHGGEEVLTLVYPPRLADHLLKKHQPLSERIRQVCGAPIQLRTIAEIQATVVPEERELIGKEAWRGTIAAIAYEQFRCPLVHELHASADGLTFSDTVYRGSPVGRISFPNIYRALQGIAAHWRTVFLETLDR